MTCVLVAGTKGKGSTAAMIAALLSASGVRAGLATKPHLQTYRERIRVDGGAISESAFAARVAALRARIGVPIPLPREVGLPTTFELTTALAVAHFAAEGCTVAVLEVGLGGRYDATNACDPHVSVVMSISHDHTAELGTSPSVLDVAHNDGSALALAAALRGEFPRRRVHLVLGIMRDKDARAVLRPLLPLAARIEVTRPRGPRGLDAAELARGIRGRPV